MGEDRTQPVEGPPPGHPTLEKVAVGPRVSVREAMRCMDETGGKLVFVLDEARRLLGVATDGDVRRWILAGKDLEAPVSEAMNRRPVTLPDGHTTEEAEELFVAHRVDSIPVVDADGRVVSALWWLDLFESKREVPEALGVPVVIMAGGEGTRLAPYTKVLPKPLIPIGETPIVELIMERFARYGCGPFVLSVNYKANLVRAYFSDLPDYDVRFVQEDEPLGTAGSLRLAAEHVGGTFFVSNCDILIDADYGDIMRFHRTQGCRLTLVASMKHFVIPYGVCEIRAGGQLAHIREKPGFDHLVSTGLYVLEPEALDDIPEGAPFHITDLVNRYVEQGVGVGVYPVSEAAWLDMGQLEELQHMLGRFGAA